MKLQATLCSLVLIATSTAAPPQFVGVRPELICEAKTIAPGQTFTVALSLKHEKTFHTYWNNPGTVGFATSLDWELPDGFTAGDIQWQVPERCEMVIYNAHGYNSDALLLVDITAPESLPDSPVILKAKGAWMACSRERCCNIGYKDFILKVNTGNHQEWNDDVRNQIALARGKLPRPIAGWQHSGKRIGDQLMLKVSSSADLPLTAADGIYFYSELNHINTLVEHGVQVLGSEVSLTLPIAEFAPDEIKRLVGLLYHPDGWPGAGGQRYMPVDLELE